MDFHHLKYFVEVADKKSFSKAARTLHISQSAISRTIKALEEELGVVLFMRNAKAVELTDAGTIFLSHAKRVVFMFEHLKTDFENEFQMAQINKTINPNLETMFLTSSEKYTFLSSSVVRELASYGADLSEFLPREIIDEVLAKAKVGGV